MPWNSPTLLCSTQAHRLAGRLGIAVRESATEWSSWQAQDDAGVLVAEMINEAVVEIRDSSRLG